MSGWVGTPYELWVHALPRLIAASAGTAIVVTAIIRLAFRLGRSYLAYRRRSPAHRLRLR